MRIDICRTNTGAHWSYPLPAGVPAAPWRPGVCGLCGSELEDRSTPVRLCAACAELWEQTIGRAKEIEQELTR